MENDTRQKLLTVAASFFSKKGYAAVSIREIADAAGANSAMISYYFGGKEGLYSAIIKMYVANLVEIRESVKELEPLERLRQYAFAVQKFYRQMPNAIGLFFGELTKHTHCYEKIFKEFIIENQKFLLQTMEEGQELEQIRSDVQPTDACIAFSGILNFYFLVKPMIDDFNFAEELQDEKYIQQAVDIYLSGIKKKNNAF